MRGTVDASARSLEWSSCNMTFFKAAVEIDMGSVRMSEVRLEPYCDSRKRHWRTSWMDYTYVALRMRMRSVVLPLYDDWAAHIRRKSMVRADCTC